MQLIIGACALGFIVAAVLSDCLIRKKVKRQIDMVREHYAMLPKEREKLMLPELSPGSYAYVLQTLKQLQGLL
jgi:hypothetical protein